MKSEYRIEIPEASVETLESVSEDDLNQLLQIEADMFNEGEWFDELEEFREMLMSETACLSVLRNINGQIVGFVLGVPALNMVDKLRNADPGYQVDESTLYITSTAILPPYRGGDSLDRLMDSLTKIASEREYKTISAHVPHRHVSAYQRRFGAKDMRFMKEWDGADIPHHYIEFPLVVAQENADSK